MKPYENASIQVEVTIKRTYSIPVKIEAGKNPYDVADTFVNRMDDWLNNEKFVIDQTVAVESKSIAFED